MLHWQEKWLQDLLEITQLPAGAARESGLQQKVEQLNSEIEGNISRNRVLESYKSVIVKPEDGPLELFLPAPSLDTPSDAIGPSRAIATSVEGQESEALRKLRAVKNLLRKGNALPNPKEDLEAQLKFVLERHRSDIPQWDIRFGYLDILLQLSEVSSEAKTKDVSSFIQARLKNISSSAGSLTAKSNVLAWESNHRVIDYSCLPLQDLSYRAL
jgi:hypothetical protein